MKKVLIIGATGMAGHVIDLFLKSTKSYDIYTTSRNKVDYKVDFQLDVFDEKKLVHLIEFIKPNIIINSVGMLNQNAETHISKAIYVNSFFPHLLSQIAHSVNAKVIHISTDCVFSGKSGSYEENSFRDGDDYYSRTKSLGELNNQRDLTIRTSIIGPEIRPDSIGLFDWIMNQNDKINGYTNAIWSGVTTMELAKFIHKSIHENYCGLCHLTNNKKISKYDLLNIINDKFKNKSIIIEPFEGKKIDKSIQSTRTDIIHLVPKYEDMLNDMRQWINQFPHLYKRYLD